MSKTNTTLTTFVIVAAIILACTVGYMIGKVGSEETVIQPVEQGVVGTAGDSYSTMKISQIGIDTSTTTIGSLYNGDSRDRVVINAYIYLEDAADTTGAARTLTAATSTEEYTHNDGSNTNYVFNSLITTSTPTYEESAISNPSEDTKITWQAGSYLNFRLSGLATTTASGFVGIEYYNE